MSTGRTSPCIWRYADRHAGYPAHLPCAALSVGPLPVPHRSTIQATTKLALSTFPTSLHVLYLFSPHPVNGQTLTFGGRGGAIKLARTSISTSVGGADVEEKNNGYMCRRPDLDSATKNMAVQKVCKLHGSNMKLACRL